MIRSILVDLIKIASVMNVEIVKIFSILSPVIGVGIAILAGSPARANPTTGTISMVANVDKSCTPPGNYIIALGNYDGRVPISLGTTVKFKCTKNTEYTVRLRTNNGTGTSADGKLNTKPPNDTPILYVLTPGATFKGIGNGVSAGADNISINPLVNVAAGQNPKPGSYSDTINIEISY
jgi:spore coat protein U-like protein